MKKKRQKKLQAIFKNSSGGAMNMNPSPAIATQPIYQADQAMLQSIHHGREQMHGVCKHHMHMYVRIHTTTGEMHEGVLVGFDNHFLYLDVSQSPMGMRFYPGPFIQPYNPYYSSQIVPLVLFDLLVISLI
jgi:hypothetical protein